jgi:hypothetical protein
VLGDSQPGQDSAPPPGLPPLLLSWWGLLAVGVFLILIALWILVFILRPQARKYLLTRLASYLLLLLLIYALFNALQDRIPTAETQPEPPAGALLGERPAPGEEIPSLPTFIANPPGWLVTTISMTFFSLLLGLGWWLWHRYGPQPAPPPADRLAREARQAVDALRRGDSLKDTVMDCYLKMTRVFEEQRNLERSQTMTAREFERYLRQAGLMDEHIQRLTRLFESVRYGAAPPSRRDEQEAIACLSAIVQSYGQPI